MKRWCWVLRALAGANGEASWSASRSCGSMGRENKSIHLESTDGCEDGGKATQENERDIVKGDGDAAAIEPDRDESRKEQEPRDEAEDDCDRDLSAVHGVGVDVRSVDDCSCRGLGAGLYLGKNCRLVFIRSNDNVGDVVSAIAGQFLHMDALNHKPSKWATYG